MSDLKRGYLFAGAAYGLWGLFPLYWKLLRPTGAVEILAHRFVWSFVLVAIIVVAGRKLAGIKTLTRKPRTLALIAAAAVVIAINWGTYIYGVNTDRVVETALGYFLNPLVTVLMGVLVLHEKLRRLQWIAIAVGASALAVITIDYGRLPWIALVLGLSFAVYGLVKKQAKLPASDGLFAETAILLVPAAGFLVWMQFTGESGFSLSVGHSLLLIGAGVITAVPLLFFAGAANRLPMTALGMGQYIAPSIQFIVGVTVFGEAMPTARWAGFGLVWLALVVFSVDAVRQTRRKPNKSINADTMAPCPDAAPAT